jgi:hypothetical protein
MRLIFITLVAGVGAVALPYLPSAQMVAIGQCPVRIEIDIELELANNLHSKTAGTKAQRQLDVIPTLVTTACAVHSSILLPHVFPEHVVFPTT